MGVYIFICVSVYDVKADDYAASIITVPVKWIRPICLQILGVIKVARDCICVNLCSSLLLCCNSTRCDAVVTQALCHQQLAVGDDNWARLHDLELVSYGKQEREKNAFTMGLLAHAVIGAVH